MEGELLTSEQQQELLAGFSRLNSLCRLPSRTLPSSKKSSKQAKHPPLIPEQCMELLARFCAFLRSVTSAPPLSNHIFLAHLKKSVSMPNWPLIFRCRAVYSSQLLPPQQVYHYHGIVDDILFLLDGICREDNEENEILREKSSAFQKYLVKHTLDPDNVLIGLPACAVANKNFALYVDGRNRAEKAQSTGTAFDSILTCSYRFPLPALFNFLRLVFPFFNF
jgi:hypothetical protein